MQIIYRNLLLNALLFLGYPYFRAYYVDEKPKELSRYKPIHKTYES